MAWARQQLPRPSRRARAPAGAVVARPPLGKVKFGEKHEKHFSTESSSELARAGHCYPRMLGVSPAPSLAPSTPTPSILPAALPLSKPQAQGSGSELRTVPQIFQGWKPTPPASPRSSCSSVTSEAKPRAGSSDAFRSQQSSSERDLPPSPPCAPRTLPDPPLRQDNLSPMFSSSWRGLAAAHGSPAPLPAPAAKRERRGLRETTGNGAGDASRKEEPELAGQERAPPRLCARIEININIEAPERGELPGHNRKPCCSAEKPRADVTARR